MDDKDIRHSDSSTEGLEDDGTLDQDLDESGNKSGQDDSSKDNKRSAETRINELSGKLRQTEDELKTLRAQVQKQPAQQLPNPESTPEAKKVIEQLKSLGFTRTGDVEEKLKTIEERIELNSEHTRLASEFDGSDGRPKYSKSQVEQYMRDHAVYDPEIAYKAMNETELLDWNLKKADAGTKKRPYVERPGGSGVARTTDTQITREKLQEVADNPSPANRDWYERNRNKILQLMAEGKL
jgi:hypothetical protein